MVNRSDSTGSSRSSADDLVEFVRSEAEAANNESLSPDATPNQTPNSTDDATVISNRPPVYATNQNSGMTPSELGTTLVGTRLAHFELVEFVGGGGMGAVFRANDTLLNRDVAVKVLSRDQGSDEETVRRFRNEAQSAARLDHDNIARVYFVGEDDGWYFIVFEFINGINIRDLVERDGPLSLQDAYSFTLQITEALDHAANRSVVHRDIKPSNVLVTASGKAKLVDMGLARLHQVSQSTNDLTASGMTLGTFDYISPEQARDPRLADTRSDIYSLGCTLFYMLTGRPPFPEGTVLQKLLSHSSESPPDPTQWRPDLPPAFGKILKRMLAKDPANRYAHPRELYAALMRAGDELGMERRRRSDAVYFERRTTLFDRIELHLPWIATALFALAGLVLIDSYWAGNAESANLPQFVSPSSAGLSRPETKIRPEHREPSTNRSEAIAQDSTDIATDTDSSQAVRSVPGGQTQGTETDDSSALGSRLVAGEQGEVANDTSELNDSPNSNSMDVRRVVVDAKVSATQTSDGYVAFRTLADAVEHAVGSPWVETIELRTGGRIECQPIRLTDHDLEILSSNGSTVLVFQPNSFGSDAIERSMIQLDGGHLRLESVHLEMKVPTTELDGAWSLIEATQESKVTLHTSSLTIRNTDDEGADSWLDDVAFIRVRPGVTDAPSDNGMSATMEVRLQDCIVRGQANLLRADIGVPVRLNWQNGLFVSTERMIRMGGVRQRASQGERIMISLEHVTAWMERGFAEFYNSEDQPNMMKADIMCRSCILETQPWAAFILHSGVDSASYYEDKLVYSGDRNFYQGVEKFWQIEPNDQNLSGMSASFEDWQREWAPDDILPSLDLVRWQNSRRNSLAAHLQTVRNFLLQPTANPAIESSSDRQRQDAGMNSARLPEIPNPIWNFQQIGLPLF
ncbi:MAG: serine/threonine protein kinase [Planctomycetales bacterium]|nr:serine/threonine protein kinase [Planctomycetales bacterium]